MGRAIQYIGEIPVWVDDDITGLDPFQEFDHCLAKEFLPNPAEEPGLTKVVIVPRITGPLNLDEATYARLVADAKAATRGYGAVRP